MLFTLVLIWITLLSRASSTYAQIPRISLKDLESFRDSDEAFNVLKDDGGKISAFYVSELGSDFNLTDFRVKAPPCIGGNEDLPALVLNDGSIRKTFGTTDSEVFPVCMGKAMVPLVEAFDRIEGAIIHLLELTLNGETAAFSSEPRGERFILPLEESPVKDHIHVYTKKNNTTQITNNSIVPFHVDNGLFLILTPFPEHGINIKTSKGTLLDTHHAQPTDLVVLMCRGLTDWFLQKSKTVKRKFFPVPHSVPSFSSSSKTERSVFARMKVVPMDALPLIGGQSRGKKPFKYVFENSDYHESPESICSIDLDQKEEESDSGRNSWLRMMDQQCQAGEAYCWMSCRPFRSECSSIEESICYSTLRNLTCSTQINGLPMDQSCQWECKKDILRSHHGIIAPTPNTYCNGKMDMYMAGFEVQGSANGSNPCIILFIEAWTLDSRIKFAFGCIGVFLLGFTIEALISLRRKISSDCRRILTFTGTSRRVKRILLIFSFGLNLALGYLAMLVAMTYSVELFCCVLLGLVCGHAFFNVNVGIISESIDPCCASGTENNYQRERSSRDSYQFSPAPCEETRASINNTPNSEDDAGSIPCCSEKQSILRTNDNQRDLVA